MSPTQYIYVATTLDDGGVTTESQDDWIEYPGRVVGGVLSEILAALGCKVEPLQEMGMLGWEFTFHYGGARFRARAGKIEDFMIVIWLRGSLDLFKRKRRAFDGLIAHLREAFPTDRRFSNIRWYTQEQMENYEWDYPERDEDEDEVQPA